MTPRKKPEDILKLGRPTIYTDELGKLICERVAANPIGLETLLKLYDDMPDHSTIKAWRLKYPDFSSRYLEAKSFQSQLLVEEIDSMIDCGINYIVDDKGQQRIDPPSASLIIAKINNRKWTAARLAPKIYGEQKHLEEKIEENAKLKDELRELQAKLADANRKDY